MRNLLFNPRPGVPGGAEYTGFYATVLYTQNRLTIKATGGYSMARRDMALPAGDYVYSAFMGGYTGADTCSTTENRGLYVVADGVFIAHQPFSGTDKRYTVNFHLDEPTTVSLRLTGPAAVGEALSYWAMLLSTKQDYDRMRTLTDSSGTPLNLTWFDGDTYPSGGLSPGSAHTVTHTAV